MTILIIGARGFIGCQLFEQLKTTEANVIGTSRTRTSQEDLFEIDLGRKNEYQKINSLVERFDINYVVNLAAADVAPSSRTKLDEQQIGLFFENLNMILERKSTIGLLQIGTNADSLNNDSYYAGKEMLKNLLKGASTNRRTAILELPKIIGPREPRGRFTSDLVHSFIMNREQIILQPCRQRNFMPVVDAALLIDRIAHVWTSGGDEYPKYEAQLFSNYEIANCIMKYSNSDPKQLKLDHPVSLGNCQLCSSDERTLLVQPEFFSNSPTAYVSMLKTSSVEESLWEQYNYSKRIQ
jgi:hypothetical protein